MKLLFAVALGGTSPNEALEGTPLVDDGFMYVVDRWGVGLQDRRALWHARDASCGKWIRARRSSTAIAASRSGTTS